MQSRTSRCLPYACPLFLHGAAFWGCVGGSWIATCVGCACVGCIGGATIYGAPGAAAEAPVEAAAPAAAASASPASADLQSSSRAPCEPSHSWGRVRGRDDRPREPRPTGPSQRGTCPAARFRDASGRAPSWDWPRRRGRRPPAPRRIAAASRARPNGSSRARPAPRSSARAAELDRLSEHFVGALALVVRK